MTTATLHKLDLWAPLRHLLQWLLPTPSRTALPSRPTVSARPKNASVLGATHQVPTGPRAYFPSKIKPLRIVRVVETDQPRSSVGRMVISGRMADVCAELDRLAACEAA